MSTLNEEYINPASQPDDLMDDLPIKFESGSKGDAGPGDANFCDASGTPFADGLRQHDSKDHNSCSKHFGSNTSHEMDSSESTTTLSGLPPVPIYCVKNAAYITATTATSSGASTSSLIMDSQHPPKTTSFSGNLNENQGWMKEEPSSIDHSSERAGNCLVEGSGVCEAEDTTLKNDIATQALLYRDNHPSNTSTSSLIMDTQHSSKTTSFSKNLSENQGWMKEEPSSIDHSSESAGNSLFEESGVCEAEDTTLKNDIASQAVLYRDSHAGQASMNDAGVGNSDRPVKDKGKPQNKRGRKKSHRATVQGSTKKAKNFLSLESDQGDCNSSIMNDSLGPSTVPSQTGEFRAGPSGQCNGQKENKDDHANQACDTQNCKSSKEISPCSTAPKATAQTTSLDSLKGAELGHDKGDDTTASDDSETKIHMVMAVDQNNVKFTTNSDYVQQISSGSQCMCEGCVDSFNHSDSCCKRQNRKRGKPFTCAECGDRFKWSKKFKVHMKVLARGKQYTCKECGKEFNCNPTLQIHMRSHTGERPFQCGECGKAFSQSGSFNRHMKMHTNEEAKFNCTECDESFQQNCDLELHAKKHISGEELVCSECSETFTKQYDFEVHMKIHWGDKPYKCEDCGRRYKRPYMLEVHRRTHTGEKPYECDECGRTFSRRKNLTLHVRTHTGEKPYECKQCGKHFATSSALHMHKRTHTGDKPFKCEECGWSFSQKRDVVRHIRTHTGEKPYECEICGKSFGRRREYNIHKTLHTGEMPFKCAECGKGFMWGYLLRDHMMAHTGEKPYKCEVCDKTFTRNENLYVHMRTHTGERPYNCEVCGWNFHRKPDLVRHWRTHTGEKPFECEICYKKFRRRSELTLHLRNHTGEKPFQCEECGKSFKRGNHLRNHKMVHTGEKPFQCGECDKRFCRSDNLLLHIRTHTRVKS